MGSLRKSSAIEDPNLRQEACEPCISIYTGLTTAYHPQANGQVERKNQEVEVYLRLFISKQQDDWVDLLPTAEFVINSQLNSATGHTPFELIYGYTPDFTVPAG